MLEGERKMNLRKVARVPPVKTQGQGGQKKNFKETGVLPIKEIREVD